MATPSSSSQGRLPVGSGNAAAAVSITVVVKLLAFTIAMIVLPIGSYYATLNRLFDGNGIYAAVTAAVVANLVVVAYIITAVLEGREPDKKKKE
ncbi:hypothetical protein BX666DRAFT_2027029 [Dichotomocladium elegans]|nr:hypothetical protein BX666DRAFT_2027029 [Dichotomocladium elegans]